MTFASGHHSHRDDSRYDDGGAEKGEERRDRRERRRFQRTVPIFLLLAVVLLFHLRSGERRARKNEARMTQAISMMRHVRDGKRHRGNKDEPPLERKPVLTNESRIKWVDLRNLPPLSNATDGVTNNVIRKTIREMRMHPSPHEEEDFRTEGEESGSSEWERDADDEIIGNHALPNVDYTTLDVTYSESSMSPPANGGYPHLQKLRDVFARWPQDELDNPPLPFVETLRRFDFSNPKEREAALLFRRAELPFKVYNVPEINRATLKWTDGYLSKEFKRKARLLNNHNEDGGRAAESTAEDNFFPFFSAGKWDVGAFGKPPTVINDWTFLQWAKHARYADKVGLSPRTKHYYWVSGISQEERNADKSEKSFISRDLPSFSDTEPNFFAFQPGEQKGIQCRFGERGVTAATHYDGGRNMVAMITGAKRYILSPPKACSQLAIITERDHPHYRHSLLNFAHLEYLEDPDSQEFKEMPKEERDWLIKSGESMAVDTILKAGEVLYIPSHWFHYIISLQKNAQCNTRSGKELEGTTEFGGFEDVKECLGNGEQG